MIGKDYVANVTLYNEKNEVVADVGDPCDRVAESSLEALLTHRLITRVDVPDVDDAKPEPTKSRKKAQEREG
jgi:hypothetical protein